MRTNRTGGSKGGGRDARGGQSGRSGPPPRQDSGRGGPKKDGPGGRSPGPGKGGRNGPSAGGGARDRDAFGDDRKGGSKAPPPPARQRPGAKGAPRPPAREGAGKGKFAPGPWESGERGRAKAQRTNRSRDADQQDNNRLRAPRTAETESLVYGFRSVSAILHADPRRIARLYVEATRASTGDGQALVDQAESDGVHVQRVSSDELATLSRGAVHQGVVAQVAPFRFSTVPQVLESERTPLLLILDEVTDPQNVGAAARAAWALGGTGLILPKDRTATITAAAEKVASGALAHLKVAEVTNLARTLEDLKSKGVWIIGLDVEGDAPIHMQDLTMPVALVIGSEQSGMRRLTREMCDAVVTIPMAHEEAALNAADAAAVALYEASRQRLTAGAEDVDDFDEE